MKNARVSEASEGRDLLKQISPTNTLYCIQVQAGTQVSKVLRQTFVSLLDKEAMSVQKERMREDKTRMQEKERERERRKKRRKMERKDIKKEEQINLSLLKDECKWFHSQ